MSRIAEAFWSLVYLFVLLLAAWGWIVNVLKLTDYTGAFGLEQALRVVGIFVVPLGSAMGWFVH